MKKMEKLPSEQKLIIYLYGAGVVFSNSMLNYLKKSSSQKNILCGVRGGGGKG